MQCPNHDRRPVHDCLADSHLAELQEHSQQNPPGPRYHDSGHGWILTLFPASASLLVHTLYQGETRPKPQLAIRTDIAKVQYFFAFKSVIAPMVFLAVFGDTLHKAGGTISRSTVVTEGVTVHGSVLAWAFFGSE